MLFPSLTPGRRYELLEPPVGKVHVVIDTDTYNQIDDQFALTYALLSQERIAVEAIYAAPFYNARSTSPADGMLKSYDEMAHLIGLLGYANKIPTYKGSTSYLSSPEQPVRSAAAEDLAERAMHYTDGPLYVIAIGAITNIASALLLRPEIAGHIVIVWLCGHASYWPTAEEFNLKQDMLASRLIFDSGVPLVHIPCLNVTDHLRTTQAELERYVKGQGIIGDYLYQIYSASSEERMGRSRPIWDMAPVAWLVQPAWVPTLLLPSPILTAEKTWSHDARRHSIRQAIQVDRDEIFGDLFHKLASHA